MKRLIDLRRYVPSASKLRSDLQRLRVVRNAIATPRIGWHARSLSHGVPLGASMHGAGQALHRLSQGGLRGAQTTVNSNDLEPTRPMSSAIWIVTLCRPLGSSAPPTNIPDGVGLACASIRLVMSIPRKPYRTCRLFTAILASAAA